MKISTKGRYGLYFMMELAGNCAKDSCMSLKNIASRQGVSEKYLEQIVQILNKEHLIFSMRGAYGGYKLAHKPKEITVGSIIKCLEKSTEIPECEEQGEKSVFVKIACEEVYEKITKSIYNVIDNITLEDLINKCNREFVLDYII